MMRINPYSEDDYNYKEDTKFNLRSWQRNAPNYMYHGTDMDLGGDPKTGEGPLLINSIPSHLSLSYGSHSGNIYLSDDPNIASEFGDFVYKVKIPNKSYLKPDPEDPDYESGLPKYKYVMYTRDIPQSYVKMYSHPDFDDEY